MTDSPALLLGDCFEVLQTLEAESVDACVTDPPYGLSFMGKHWDKGVPDADMWRQVFRVLKPGAHLLSFFGTRTYHRGVVAIEDAGFEIRDRIGWLYGSGFPKSLDVSKAIDKAAGRIESGESTVSLKHALINLFNESGMTRKSIDDKCGFRASNYLTLPSEGKRADPWVNVLPSQEKWATIKHALGCDTEAARRLDALLAEAEREITGQDTKARSTSGKSALPTVGGETVYETWDITAPATEAAQKWEGWGTALKPAWEPIVVARKPFPGRTVAQNVLKHGTGGLNIDGCRVGPNPGYSYPNGPGGSNENTYGEYAERGPVESTKGRWPANIVHDGSDEVLAEFAKYGELRARGNIAAKARGMRHVPSKDRFLSALAENESGWAGDTGTAARFFKTCEETDEEWLDRNLYLSVASIADSSLSLQNQSVASALNYAVTSALPVGSLFTSLSQGPTTNVTPNELRRIAESAIEAMPSIVRKFLLEQEPIKRSQTRNRVNVVASATRTGTTMITIDRWRSDGSVDPVTFSITETSADRGDRGSQSRIHYTAKASKDDRNDGLHDYDHTEAADMVDREPDSAGMNSPRAGAGRTSGAKNHHPTVKPTSLMRYLVKLVCPKGGLVLDPFAGSGTTLIAAYREDCRAVGIELDPDYFKMASHRIDKATAQLRLEL